jgi:hypothetical protein
MNKFFISVVLGGLSMSLFATMYFLVEVAMNKEPLPPKYSIEVVGNYKECEILQYTNSNLANYHYLLYCGDQK